MLMVVALRRDRLQYWDWDGASFKQTWINILPRFISQTIYYVKLSKVIFLHPVLFTWQIFENSLLMAVIYRNTKPPPSRGAFSVVRKATSWYHRHRPDCWRMTRPFRQQVPVGGGGKHLYWFNNWEAIEDKKEPRTVFYWWGGWSNHPSDTRCLLWRVVWQNRGIQIRWPLWLNNKGGTDLVGY